MKNIKFIALLILGLFATQVNSFAADPTFETWTNKSRDIGKQGTPVRVLKLVRLASRDVNTVSAVSGDAVVYDKISDDGVTIAHTRTSADGAIAGILATTIQTADSASVVTQDDAGRRNWGWMVVHGPMTARVRNGGANAPSVGDPFYTSRDGAVITTLEVIRFSDDGGTTALNSNALLQAKASSNRGGFFFDTVGSTDTVADVFVMLE